MIAETGFFWILAAGVVYGSIHSLLASLALKKAAERLFGAAGKRWYRFFFVIMAIPTTLAYVGLIFLLPDETIYTIPLPWVLLTGLVELAALTGMALSLMRTGSLSFLGLWPFFHPGQQEPPAHLITDGIFSVVRHPIYFFTFIFIWLAPRMTWNLLALNIGITLYTLIAGSTFEEHKLHLEFGSAYSEYARKVPRFLPKITKK